MSDLYNVARVCDVIGHGGAIVTGSSDVEINGKPAAMVTSIAACCLHGAAPVATGSESVTINGYPATFVTCLTACGAPIVTGSDDVLIGG